MAWSDANQHMAHAIGARLEFGAATLDANGTVEVATHLSGSSIYAGFATYKSGAIAEGGLRVDCTITSDAVTVADSLGAVNAGAIVNYLFIGLP